MFIVVAYFYAVNTTALADITEYNVRKRWAPSEQISEDREVGDDWKFSERVNKGA